MAANDTLAKVKERGSDGFLIQADVSRPDAVTLLCMEEAGFITGQIIHVDGGASIMDTVFPLEIQRG